MPKKYFIKNNYSRTWSRQRIGHFITHFRHCVHLLLFKVQVLLCTLTVIAFTGHTNSHLPHNVHLFISLPIRQRDLCDDFKNSENKCIPNSNPIDPCPLPCLPINTILQFLGIPNFMPYDI